MITRVYYEHNNKIVTLQSDVIKNSDSDDFVLIKILYCGICDSDIKEICGTRLTRRDFGHECLGIIEGSSNAHFTAGSYVTLDPHVKVNRGTCFANYVRLSANIEILKQAIITLPSNEIQFVLTEPLACSLHAVNNLLNVRCDYNKILVYGAGTFGYLIYLSLLEKKINVFLGNRTHQRIDELEKNVGVINKFHHDSNDKFDAIIISQSYVSCQDFVKLAPYMNTGVNILLFGSVDAHEPAYLYDIRNNELVRDIDYHNIHMKLIGNLGADNNDFKDAVKLLTDKNFSNKAKKIISTNIKFSQGLDTLNEMVNGKKYFGKTVIELFD